MAKDNRKGEGRRKYPRYFIVEGRKGVYRVSRARWLGPRAWLIVAPDGTMHVTDDPELWRELDGGG
ncbi:MAG: hypothetical protein QW324_08970 [Thermofilaceae archaeon]